jgi:nitrite reductase/ring-hydroxylating ferredoxin subunit
MADAQRLICPSPELVEGGTAVRFEIDQGDHKVACFAVRHDGVVRAYVNSCPHARTELDWQPGEVFDETGLYLICATHGAAFDPASGLCVSGPCRGDRLYPVPTHEVEGQVRLALPVRNDRDS